MSSPYEGAAKDEEYEEQLSLLKDMEETSRYWTGTNERYNVEYEALSSEGKGAQSRRSILGCGKNGEVSQVICGKVPMAGKSVKASTYLPLAALKSEVEAIQKLESHRHIVKLVGSYTTSYHEEETLHILMFPVAHCDLDVFLNSLEDVSGIKPRLSSKSNHLEPLELLSGAGLAPVQTGGDELLEHLGLFLQKSMGCIAGALWWIHDRKIAHDDLKPANILLRRGKIFITDFGISRDRCEAETTSTETWPGDTPGYSAPEKRAREKHDPFQADVYSLGCIYMHLLTVISRKSTRQDCVEALQSGCKKREQMVREYLRQYSPTLLHRVTSAVWQARANARPYTKLTPLINNQHAPR